MSDLLLGAIIGAGRALIGSIIGAMISYRTNKAQINARTIEQQQLLKHQELEARRSRLIETRKSYLIPLRETASKWVVELTRMIDQTDSLGKALKMHEQYPFLYPKPESSQKQAIEEIEARMKALKEELEVLRGQVSDTKLNDAVDNVLFRELDVSVSSWPILHSTWDEWKSGKKDVNSVDGALDEIRTTSVELRDHLQLVNKRVEELLSGNEAE